jgi:tetratricopeptide (TPR) repeat protein
VITSHQAGPRILLLRARLLAGHRAYDRAEADALRAFEASPSLDEAIDLLVAIYEAQGKSDEALRSFREADAAGVLHWGARVLLARLYLARGDNDAAVATLEQVVEQQPEAAAAQRDLAQALAQRGTELERAGDLAHRARKARPDDPMAAHVLGLVYFKQQRYEAALGSYEEAIELAGDHRPDLAPTFHYHSGLALQALGREQRAAAAFETALSLDANFPDAADARRQLEAVRNAG